MEPLIQGLCVSVGGFIYILSFFQKCQINPSVIICIFSWRLNRCDTVCLILLQPNHRISRIILCQNRISHKFFEAFRNFVTAGSVKGQPSFPIRVWNIRINQIHQSLRSLKERINNLTIHTSHRRNHGTFIGMKSQHFKQTVCNFDCSV